MIERLLQRTGFVLLGSGASKAILLGMELFIAGGLGAAAYGGFSLALAVLFVTANIAILGFNFGIIQYLAVHQEEARADQTGAVIRSALAVTVCTGLVAAILVWSGAGWLAERVFSKPELAPSLRIVAFAIPFETVNQTMSAGFRGLRRFGDHVMVSDLLRNAFAMVAVLVLSVHGLRLTPVLWMLVIGDAAATAVGLWRIRAHLGPTGGGKVLLVARDLLRFSYLLIAWNLFQQLSGRGLLLLAGIYLSSADVGVISAYTRLLLLFTFFQTAINQTTPVEFARLHHLHDRDALQRTYAGITLALLIIATITALPLLVSPPVLLGLLGAEFRKGAWWLVPLVVTQLLNVGTGPAGQLLIACHRQKAVFIASMVAGLAQLLLGMALMPSFGLAGAVVSGSATVVVLTGLRLEMQWRLERVGRPHPRWLGTVALGLAASAAGVVIARLIPGVPGWLLGSSVGLLMFVGGLFPYLRQDADLRNAVVARWRRGAMRGLPPAAGPAAD